MIKPRELDSFSTYLLAKEAERRGIAVIKIFPDTTLSYLRLEYKGKKKTIIGQRINELSFNAHMICVNKEMTRRFLVRSGIETIAGDLFTNTKIKEAISFIKKIGYPIVIKPVDETWGNGVHLDIKNINDAKKAIKKILKTKKRFLVEKQFVGQEYRIFASREKLLGIINRIPANIIGDGKNTIKKLITIKNKDPRRGDGHEKALVKIKVDQEILKNLREKGLSLKTVPDKNERVFLRKNSNLSTGGDSIDITDKAHAKIKKLAPRVIQAIPGLPYAGFDFMTPDITKDPEITGYAIIEINDSPMLSMHHMPYLGKKRNIAKEIIDMTFPDTREVINKK